MIHYFSSISPFDTIIFNLFFYSIVCLLFSFLRGVERICHRIFSTFLKSNFFDLSEVDFCSTFLKSIFVRPFWNRIFSFFNSPKSTHYLSYISVVEPPSHSSLQENNLIAEFVIWIIELCHTRSKKRKFNKSIIIVLGT